MKNILKSVATIGALAAMLTVTTNAWFTSTAVATDNVITTGTLSVSIDSAQDDSIVNTIASAVWGYPNAYTVVNNGVATGDEFMTWTNAAPGDTNSYVVAVRNGSTIPFKFNSTATGAWVSGANFTGGICPEPDGTNSDPTLVQVTNVHQYASNNCEGQIGCENLYYGLLTGPWTNTAGLSAGDVASPTTYYGKVAGNGVGANAIINPGEFAIYRVDTRLSTAANNCYQGATYNFDLTVNGYQAADPTPGF